VERDRERRDWRMTSKRSVVVSCATVLALALTLYVSGCGGGDSPAGPESVVNDLHITGYYFHFPAGSPAGITNGAAVIIREGNSTGPVVDDLTVTVNDYQLTFQQALGLYSGVAPSLVPGQNATFKISDGLGSVQQTVQVPYAISNLGLLGGYWSTYSALTVNSLAWDNPIVVGEGIATYLYDYDGVAAHSLYWAATELSQSTTFTVMNSQLAYYQSITSILVLCGQINYALFPQNPAGSGLLVMTGVWGSWPASASLKAAGADAVRLGFALRTDKGD